MRTVQGIVRTACCSSMIYAAQVSRRISAPSLLLSRAFEDTDPAQEDDAAIEWAIRIARRLRPQVRAESAESWRRLGWEQRPCWRWICRM